MCRGLRPFALGIRVHARCVLSVQPLAMRLLTHHLNPIQGGDPVIFWCLQQPCIVLELS